MAITIAWGTKIINIPQVDLTYISGSLYELDVDDFRLTLKDLEDDEAGMPFLRTHNHNTEVTVAGTVLSRVVEIINGYTVTFQDGQYAVRLVGANNNISDVTNINQVSIRSNNSAGLIADQAELTSTNVGAAVLDSTVEGTYTLKQVLRIISAVLAGKSSINDLGGGNAEVIFRNISDTLNRSTFDLVDSERTDRVDNLG